MSRSESLVLLRRLTREGQSILVSGHQQHTGLPAVAAPGAAAGIASVRSWRGTKGLLRAPMQGSTGRMQMEELGLDWQEGESCVGVKAKRGLLVQNVRCQLFNSA